MASAQEFLERLLACPPGLAGWKEFEDTCAEILTWLFVPPLASPIRHTGAQTLSGTLRRDIAFPNHNLAPNTYWTRLLEELNARVLICDFKNHDREEIGKEAVEQIGSYMTAPVGRLSILVCNKMPDHSAHVRRNMLFSSDRKVVLFLTKEHLKEMLFIKQRDGDPAVVIMDLVDRFYLQYE